MRRIVLLITLLTLASCDRRDAKSVAQSSPPPTAPSTIAATQPAADETEKPSSIAMLIEEKRIEFPPAKLRVGTTDDKVVALLYSDDPKDALKDKYAGNSFYFQMELEADDVKHFANSDWRFKATSNEQTDSPYGIFLEGQSKQLQPIEVTVTFEPSAGDQTLITISGKFLYVNVEDATQPSRLVPLLAEFNAKTVLKQ